MKNIIKTIVILLLACPMARATLIDLTPGGFNTINSPPEFYQFINEWNQHQFDFFDEATTKGWVSQYGILNGGTYFFTSLIGHPGQSTTISWNFGMLPGWSMSRILIEGTAADGSVWDNIYAVPSNLRQLDSLETVLITNGVIIHDVDFFGRWPGSPIPDKGSTVLLLSLGLLGIVVFKSKMKGNNNG